MKLENWRSILTDFIRGRASLGTSTVVTQFSMLAFLFALKLTMTSGNFAAFLVTMSIASIVGTVASLRSEVLITQADGCVYKRTLLWPVLIAFAVIALFWVAHRVIDIKFATDVTLFTLILAIGFAIQSICQFVQIQEARFSQLLMTRLGQATMLALTATAAFTGMRSDWTVWGFAFAMITPSALWTILWLLQKHTPDAPPYYFKASHLRRSGILSLTLLVNTTAINIPIILCVATQPSSYAADFGLLLKIFGAAMTLASAMFGQLFMADNIRRNISEPDEAQAIRRSMHSTSVRALTFVSVISLAFIPAVFFIADIFPNFLGHPYLALAIAIAVIAQSGFSPVSAIGEIGKLENSFLVFYLLRIALLYGLLSASLPIDFATLFGCINLVIYSVFWLYADFRIRGIIGRCS